MDVYFSNYFKVKEKQLEKYGAFNISLIADMPLFIDPFLLFNSRRQKYRKLHSDIIHYLIFLKEKSVSQTIDIGAIKAWFVFKEVVQNWLGFSLIGNRGSALGIGFGTALNGNLHKIFHDFGDEKKNRITRGSHLEKLCLIKSGVGRDNISDFTTNLIKEYLLDYTQTFAQKYIDMKYRCRFRVQRVRFNYKTESWEEGTFDLPAYNDDFVLLTPKDLLTRDETWINRSDLINKFERIPQGIANEELRFKINNYFFSCLPKPTKKKNNPTKQERQVAAIETILQFPEVIDYYIKIKEDKGEEAENISTQKVVYSQTFFIENVQNILAGLDISKLKQGAKSSYDEAREKILLLKDYIENNDGYKYFYYKGKRIKNEKDFQLLFLLTCRGSNLFDVNREVNNGRGPVDFIISKGGADKTLIEFKLASNNKLEQNLHNQVEIYKKANNTNNAFKVILYFTREECTKVTRILKRLKLDTDKDIILIDARKDNKVSASKA